MCDALGGLVAIKVYDESSQKKRRMATREAIVLKYLNSWGVPNIPLLFSAYSARSQFHLVQEYCGGGDLLAALQERQEGFPEDVVATQFAIPLLCTLDAMHSAGVVHRDIKLENIFVDGAGRPRLGDFDLAVFTHDAPARGPVGTVPYMAPEVLLMASYKNTPLQAATLSRLGPPLDVWSLGVCLFELVAGYKPFQGVSYQGVASAVLNHAREALPRGASAAFEDFVGRCLTHNASARPAARELLLHPWLAGRGGEAAAACAGAAASAGRGCAVRSDSAGSMEELRSRARTGNKTAGPARGAPALTPMLAGACCAPLPSAAAVCLGPGLRVDGGGCVDEHSSFGTVVEDTAVNDSGYSSSPSGKPILGAGGSPAAATEALMMGGLGVRMTSAPANDTRQLCSEGNWGCGEAPSGCPPVATIGLVAAASAPATQHQPRLSMHGGDADTPSTAATATVGQLPADLWWGGSRQSPYEDLRLQLHVHALLLPAQLPQQQPQQQQPHQIQQQEEQQKQEEQQQQEPVTSDCSASEPCDQSGPTAAHHVLLAQASTRPLPRPRPRVASALIGHAWPASRFKQQQQQQAQERQQQDFGQQPCSLGSPPLLGVQARARPPHTPLRPRRLPLLRRLLSCFTPVGATS